MRRASAFLTCSLFVLAAAVDGRGQAFQGGLRGAVRDPGGAVIPGAEVALVNEATNVSRSTVTNEVGEYNFSSVAPGTYRIRVSTAGFKAYEQSGVNIGTQQFITLDVKLEVGAVSEQIQVISDAPLIESSTASTGGLLTDHALQDLPNTGRNPFMMALTVPNVIHTGNPFYVRMQDQTNSSLLSLGGGPIRGNNYTLDGVPVTDLRNRAIFVPNIDAVKEIKVQVNTYDAEMGRTGGGVFNTTMKSGANSYHGHVHLQQRPSAWAANDFFLNRAGQPKQDFFYWLWGGSGGGPIRKDKTFFWATHEGYHTGTVWVESHNVPTELQRKGDFSQTSATIYDPLTTKADPNNPGRYIRDPFPDNKIPDSRINSVGRELVKYWPSPKSAGDSNNFTGSDILLDNTWQTTVKVDHNFSPRQSISGNYSNYRSREPFAVYWRGTPGEIADVNNTVLYRDVHMPIVNYTATPSSTSVLNIRYGYYWWKDSCVPASAGFDLSKLGFDSNFVSAAPGKLFPNIGVEGYRGLGAQLDIDIFWRSHSLLGSYSKLVGRHNFKFGGAWRKIAVDFTDRSGGVGTFNFSRAFTQRDPTSAAGSTGNGVASLLLGFADSGSIETATPLNFFTQYYAAFVHDDVRVTPKLTVNVGLRYEFETDLKESANQLVVGFDRTAKSPLADKVTDLSIKDRIKGGLMYAGVGGNPDHQGDPQTTRFQPRIGLAYSLRPKTVVRMGYGIYYAPLPLFYPANTAFGALGFVASTDYLASVEVGRPANTRGIANPFPQGLRKPTGSSLGLLTNAGGTVDFVDQGNKYGRVQQYSLDIQHELPGTVVLTLGFIGSSSHDMSVNGTSSTGRVDYNQLPLEYLSLGSALLTSVSNPFVGIAEAGDLGLATRTTVQRAQLLRPFPEFTRVRAVRKSDGVGRYNAFILKVERRLDRFGLGMTASYTGSKMLDNYFGEANNFINRTALPLNNYDLRREYSYSIFDVAHRVVLAPIWDLPFGRGRRWASSGLAEKVLGGWNIAPIIQVQSGFPTSVWQSSNNVAGGFAYGGQQFPNLVPNAEPCTSGRPQDRLNAWFNESAFTPAPSYTLGNAPRRFGNCRGPGLANMDISVRKAVSITEGTRLSFRVEALNATNTPRFSAPDSSFRTGSTFGYISSTQGFARIVQWMLRFDF